MGNNTAVIYSFLLYVVYVLLPLIPAILIFKLFHLVRSSMNNLSSRRHIRIGALHPTSGASSPPVHSDQYALLVCNS